MLLRSLESTRVTAIGGDGAAAKMGYFGGRGIGGGSAMRLVVLADERCACCSCAFAICRRGADDGVENGWFPR